MIDIIAIYLGDGNLLKRYSRNLPETNSTLENVASTRIKNYDQPKISGMENKGSGTWNIANQWLRTESASPVSSALRSSN